MSKILAASAGLALAATALATGNVTIGGGGAQSIVDNTTSSSSLTTNVGSPFTVVGVSFQGLSHTWVGDLSMTLTGPGAGNSFNFFFRPGQTTPTSVGQNADFVTANQYSFVDGGAAWFTGGGVVPSGAYAPIRSAFAPAQAINSFGGLNGVDGSWTLSIQDNAGGDTGGIQGWSLIVKPIPTPGAAALLGVAGLAGIRRRR